MAEVGGVCLTGSFHPSNRRFFLVLCLCCVQVILNRDTNAQCDPNLLPQPNHVMLNHMYALSIKASRVEPMALRLTLSSSSDWMRNWDAFLGGIKLVSRAEDEMSSLLYLIPRVMQGISADN